MGDGKKEMLRKKYHVVRKKTHVVRKLFYVASIFGGAAGRKNRLHALPSIDSNVAANWRQRLIALSVTTACLAEMAKRLENSRQPTVRQTFLYSALKPPYLSILVSGKLVWAPIEKTGAR